MDAIQNTFQCLLLSLQQHFTGTPNPHTVKPRTHYLVGHQESHRKSALLEFPVHPYDGSPVSLETQDTVHQHTQNRAMPAAVPLPPTTLTPLLVSLLQEEKRRVCSLYCCSQMSFFNEANYNIMVFVR